MCKARREHQPNAAYRDTVDRLESDKQFVEQVRESRTEAQHRVSEKSDSLRSARTR